MICPSGQQDLNAGLPLIEYVTVNPSSVAGIITRDLLVKFSRPYKFFFVASMTNAQNACGIYVHFVQLSLAQTGASLIVLTGIEQWFPLSTNVSGGHATGRYFVLDKPVAQFYIDCDHPANGGAFNITFGGTNDIEDLEVVSTLQ